jgi:hypothetical protein
MKPLPAKGLARSSSWVALAGCGLSLSMHALALLGFYSKEILNFQLALFVGVFPLFIPVILAQERLLSEFSFSFGEHLRLIYTKIGRKRARRISRALVANAPKWLRIMTKGLSVNAAAQFLILGYRTFPTNPASKSEELRFLSAFAAVFYSAAAEMLLSYSGSESPISPESISISRD